MYDFRTCQICVLKKNIFLPIMLQIYEWSIFMDSPLDCLHLTLTHSYHLVIPGNGGNYCFWSVSAAAATTNTATAAAPTLSTFRES